MALNDEQIRQGIRSGAINPEDLFREKYGRGYRSDAEKSLWVQAKTNASFSDHDFEIHLGRSEGVDALGIDELGFTKSGTVPHGAIGPDAQLRSEQAVARYNQTLGKQAIRSLQSGLESLSYYRPGGAAGLASGQQSNIANALLGMRTEAPDLLHGFRQDEARKARNAARDAALTSAIGTIGGAAIGGVAGALGGGGGAAAAGSALGGAGPAPDIPSIPGAATGQASSAGSPGALGAGLDAGGMQSAINAGMSGQGAPIPSVGPQTQPEGLSQPAQIAPGPNTQQGGGLQQQAQQAGQAAQQAQGGAVAGGAIQSAVGQMASGGLGQPQAGVDAGMAPPDPKAQAMASFASGIVDPISDLTAMIYSGEFSGDGFYDMMESGIRSLMSSIGSGFSTAPQVELRY